MEGLGQSLFLPPNVKGWDGGTQWLNSATLLSRHNLAAKIVRGKSPISPGSKSSAYSDARELRVVEDKAVPEEQPHDKDAEVDPTKLVNESLELLLQGDISAEARRKLISMAKAVKGTFRRVKTIHAVSLLPEYQLA